MVHSADRLTVDVMSLKNIIVTVKRNQKLLRLYRENTIRLRVLAAVDVQSKKESLYDPDNLIVVLPSAINRKISV